MKLEQSFEVDAPLDQVWTALIDVERVTPNLPGAAVTGRNEDGSYNGTFTIKIGPTTASYTGKLEMQDVDESSHSATMHAQGSDKRGQGGATATISSRLTQLNGRTKVEVVTDYHITGRLARFGRGGMIEDISERLLREFASRLQSSLEGGPVGAADPGEDEETEQPTAESPRVTEPEPAGEPAASAEPEPGPVPLPTDAAEAVAAEPDTEAVPPPPPPAPEAAPPPPPTGAAPSPPPPPTGAAPPPPADSAPPVQGLSLVGGVLLSRIKKNPAPVIGVVGGLVLLRLLLRRR